MADEVGRQPRLAAPGDVGRLLTNDRVHHAWPPPGTHVLYIGFPEPWCIVFGEVDGGAPGDWWVTDLGTIVESGGAFGLEILERIGSRFTGPIAAAFGSLLQWPVIYEQEGGRFVRWLKITLAGTLGGGVEQFQHGFSLGRPGADPDLSVDAQLALAEQISTIWQTNWTDTATGATVDLANTVAASARYTEVGVAQIEKDGSDVTQADETQWFPYDVGTGPVGAGATLPFEVACAVTLQTNVRGARGRGRMYLPPFASNNVGSDGLFTANVANSTARNIGQFLQAIIDGTPHEPIVVSRVHTVLNRVVEVSCGRVPDSQRRRRRSQDEARAAAPAIDYS